MKYTGRRTDQVGPKVASPASLFAKVLQAFEGGDIDYSDVRSDLQRLLKTGTSPQELREILRRRELIEPLPKYAHAELARMLSDAIDRDTPAAPTVLPTERPLEPSAAAAGTLSADTAMTRPVAARAPVNGAESVRAAAPVSSSADLVSSLQQRISRQKAEYRALAQSYERAKEAGSVATARAISLAAELAAAQSALEVEQGKTRELDKALTESMTAHQATHARSLSESVASDKAARARTAEVLRESEGYQGQMRTLRDSLAARDTSLSQARASLAERDAQLAALDARLAALQREHAQSAPALASRETRVAQLTADLQAARAQASAQAAELASTRAALDSSQGRAREIDRALTERIAAEQSTRLHGDDALRQSEQYRVEVFKLRDSLVARQQEHANVVTALEARAKALEAQLRAARMRGDSSPPAATAPAAIAPVMPAPVTPAPSPTARVPNVREPAAYESTEQMPNLREAVPQQPPAHAATDWDAEVPPMELGPSAARRRFDAQQTSPMPLDAEQDVPIPTIARDGVGRRRASGNRGRTIGICAAIGVLAVVLWSFAHRTPVPVQEAPVVEPAMVSKAGTVIRDCASCPALTVVPPGRFKQGTLRTDGPSASFEKPVHWVAIGQPFAVSTNAVTVDEFRAFITATGRDMRGCDVYDDRWRVRPENNWENPGFVQTGLHPVACVSWDDAKAYAAWLSTTTGHRYRLPSAAEWEYAARAGGEAVQPWSPDGSGACADANVADQRAAHRYPGWTVFACDDGFVYTAPVGSFKANAFGLNDMLGNVFQWTDDCWHPDYTGASTDGSPRSYGDCSERELRGGSWFTTPEFVRASYRNHFRSNYRASTVGIRLVRDI